jgi:hypothetical protein
MANFHPALVAARSAHPSGVNHYFSYEDWPPLALATFIRMTRRYPLPWRIQGKALGVELVNISGFGDDETNNLSKLWVRRSLGSCLHGPVIALEMRAYWGKAFLIQMGPPFKLRP